MSETVASPYAAAARELLALGYNPVPIMAPDAPRAGAGKAPGAMRSGVWEGLGKWQEFRDKPPSEFQLNLWTRNWPRANVGLVLGTFAGPGHHVIAVDVDTDDAASFQAILQALPASPMVKRGRKGETRFYRSPRTIKSKPYDDERQRAADKAAGVTGGKYRLVDLLTGFDTRQTVCPPSVHPEGPTYTWLAGPVAAADLPVFAEAELERLEAALSLLGWQAMAPRVDRPASPAAPSRPYTPPIEADDIWSEVKAAALADLDRWVPNLGLYGLQRARGGYEAVTTWRASSGGRPLEQRKRNLSIQPSGIKDWGDNRGYSAIDLVMAVQGVEQEAATDWLRGRLGLLSADVIVLTPKPATVAQLRTIEPAEPTPAAASVTDIGELPAALTRVPGLVGELVDWIADSARRPQRGLALGAALTIVGTAAGRKYAGPTRTGTQLYVLGLARTSAGKDHALNAIPRVLASVGMHQHVGPSQFMSLSALVNRITRQPLTLSPMDEFGAFLARINNRRASPHEKAITGMLRTAWGASFQTVSPPEWSGRTSEPIHAPALSIYGVSTPEEFYESLAGGDVHNGFLNRFLLLSTRKRPAERDPKVDPFTVPETIRASLHRIFGSGSALVQSTMGNGQADGPLITATWDDDAARGVYTAFGRALEDRESDMAFLARTVEMAQRLAAIRAIGIRHDAPRITVADMEWGRDVALWSAERMKAETADYMADTQNQADAQRVLRIVRERGRIKHGDLVRAMQHRLKARDLKELIGGLADGGQLAVEVELPVAGGKETRFYQVR